VIRLQLRKDIRMKGEYLKSIHVPPLRDVDPNKEITRWSGSQTVQPVLAWILAEKPLTLLVCRFHWIFPLVLNDSESHSGTAFVWYAREPCTSLPDFVCFGSQKLKWTLGASKANRNHKSEAARNLQRHKNVEGQERPVKNKLFFLHVYCLWGVPYLT